MDKKELVELKNAASVKLIDFEHVAVWPGLIPGTQILVVSGTAPCLNMEVRLSPYLYIACPEYWGIEVTATLTGSRCLDAIQPFMLIQELSDMTGSKGIEVIGASKSEKIEVAGGCLPIN